MTPLNKAFGGVVHNKRHELVSILRQMKMQHDVYVSKHFVERIVERNLDVVDAARMLVPVIKEFKSTTFNKRSFLVKWKQFRMAAIFDLGRFSERRMIILKTMYDADVDEMNFDVVVEI